MLSAAKPRLLTKLAKQAIAPKGMHVGLFLVSRRRKVSVAVHAFRADNLFSGMSAAAYNVEATSSFYGTFSFSTAFSTPAIGRKHLL
jgi:hypothetical protein